MLGKAATILIPRQIRQSRAAVSAVHGIAAMAALVQYRGPLRGDGMTARAEAERQDLVYHGLVYHGKRPVPRFGPPVTAAACTARYNDIFRRKAERERGCICTYQSDDQASIC